MENYPEGCWMKLEALIKLNGKTLLELEANLEQGHESKLSRIGRVIWQPYEINGELKNMFINNIMIYDEFLKLYKEAEKKAQDIRKIGDRYESKFQLKGY